MRRFQRHFKYTLFLLNTNLIVLLSLERDIFSLIWLIYAKRVENTI